MAKTATIFDSWTEGMRSTFITRYTNMRRAGEGKAASRIGAQDGLPREFCYSETNVSRWAGLPDGLKKIINQCEVELASWPAQYPVVEVQAAAEPAKAAPEPVVEDLEEAGVETYVRLLTNAIQADLRREMNEKLNKILDYITAPEAVKADAAKMLYEATEDRQRKPKLLIIGLIGSQPHIVQAQIQGKFKISFLGANEVTGNRAKPLVQSSDLVVTMTNFISHDTEDVIKKHMGSQTKWLRHTGGISQLVEKIKQVLI